MITRSVPFGGSQGSPRTRDSAGGSNYWLPENPGYRSPPLRGTDPITLDGKPVPPRRWVVEDWIPEGECHMLSGDGGVGKSLLAQQMMTCAAAGVPWLGRRVRQCKAIGIFCEDRDEELHRRQAAINKALGLEFGDLEKMMWVSRKGADNALVEYEDRFAATGKATEFFQQIHDLAQNFGAELIVLDSLHNFYPGNENDRRQTMQFVDLLAGLAWDCQGAVVLCAHPSRDGMATGSGYSGSTAWHNSVRSRAYLTRPEGIDGEADPDARVLRNMKANYGAMGGVIDIRWKDGAFEIDEQPTGIFKGLEDRRVETWFLAEFDKLAARGILMSHARRARNFAVREMEVRAAQARIRTDDLARALQRLLDQRRLEVGAVRIPGDARPRVGLRRPPAASAPESAASPAPPPDKPS